MSVLRVCESSKEIASFLLNECFEGFIVCVCVCVCVCVWDCSLFYSMRCMYADWRLYACNICVFLVCIGHIRGYQAGKIVKQQEHAHVFVCVLAYSMQKERIMMNVEDHRQPT